MRKSLHDFCIEQDKLELLAEWDKEKNGDLSPHNVSRGSQKKIWWKCALGHSWEAAVYSRSGYGSGCPYCAGKKLSPSARTLSSVYPELAAEWHPTKNFGLTPHDVPPGTHRKVWWRCNKGHEWRAEVKSRTSGTGCPVCTNQKVLIGENDLATTHPEVAAQWHPTKNGVLTPQSVVQGSRRKVWWRCDKGHVWEAAILSRTGLGCGCPVCAGKIILPGQNDLASQKPQIAAQWHPTKNGSLTPKEVMVYSNRRVWWICDKGHEYRMDIGSRSMRDSGCPYCHNRKVLEGFNDLATLEPAIAKQWHPELNGNLTPQMVTLGSHKKVWWQCAEGHIWQAVIYSRTGNTRSGCPVCAGKIKKPKQDYYAKIAAEALQKKK